MSEAPTTPKAEATYTDHPVLTEFRKVYLELLGRLPRDLRAEISDDPERDLMQVRITGLHVRGPFEVKFTAEKQGLLTDEEWGKMVRDLMRTWLKMRMAGESTYRRKERRR